MQTRRTVGLSDSTLFSVEMSSFKGRLAKRLAFRNDKSSRHSSSTDSVPRSTTPTTATAKSPDPLRSSSQRNLWEEAFEKLSAEERQILAKEQRKEPLVILEDVIGLVEKRSLEYQDAGWKIRRRGSKPDFNIRDGAIKVLKSVMTFKDIIASGVAHDPTGYGKHTQGRELSYGN